MKEKLCFVVYSKEYSVNCLTWPFCPAIPYLDCSSVNFIPAKFNFDSPTEVQVFLCFLRYFTNFYDAGHPRDKDRLRLPRPVFAYMSCSECGI